MHNGPLTGIRILDLSRILAGPWAGQLLADYGADVIKIEQPGSGDETRRWGPPWITDAGSGQPADSAYYLSANRNKRSMTCNLAHADGRALVAALAETADVVLENFRVGTMEQFGLDAATLRSRNPRLIYCSVSAFGQNGPRAGEPGYDAMIQAGGGLMSVTGEPDEAGGRPQKVGVAVADIMAGMYASTAILAALHRRNVSGQGDTIDVPLFDTQVAWLANQAMNYLVGGTVPGRHGTGHPNLVPYQAFPTQDGDIMIAVGSDRQFNDCMLALGLDEVADDARYRENAGRVKHRDALLSSISTATRGHTTADLLSILGEAGIACGPINDLAAVFGDPHVEHAGLVRTLERGDAGEVPTVLNPVRFEGSGKRADFAPPALGEHTDEILREELGYDAEKIAALRADGAI